MTKKEAVLLDTKTLPTPPLYKESDGVLRFQLVVSSSITDPTLRKALRLAFGDAVTTLTGYEKARRGEVSAFMQGKLTEGMSGTNPNRVPAHADLMHAKLKAYYIPTMHTWFTNHSTAAEGTLKNYMPVLMGIIDTYTIGEDGEYYCHHYFSLNKKSSPSEMLTVESGGVTATVALVCVGQSKP